MNVSTQVYIMFVLRGCLADGEVYRVTVGHAFLAAKAAPISRNVRSLVSQSVS